MELGKQIKIKRNGLNLSQDDLADKIYVTRQTISNWENDKNYPDIHSLLLSQAFDISLDELIKGDIDMIKEEIKKEDILAFNKTSKIFSILFISSIISLVPLFHYLDIYGNIIWGVLFVIALFYGLKVEKLKKTNNVQTYKEITAFMDGKKLDEVTKHQEYGKRNYQKFVLVLCSGAVGFILTFIIIYIFSMFN